MRYDEIPINIVGAVVVVVVATNENPESKQSYAAIHILQLWLCSTVTSFELANWNPLCLADDVCRLRSASDSQ